MFMVISKNDYHGYFVVLKDNLRTLEAASSARKFSGDLVVDKRTYKVPADATWLWDWERKDPTTYAHRHLDKEINRYKEIRTCASF